MKHVFDRDFDLEAETGRVHGVTSPQPSATVKDLERAVAAAREDAYAQGFEEGRRAAETEFAASQSQREDEIMEAVLNTINTLLDDVQSGIEALEQQALAFILAVFEKVAPEVVAAQSERRAEAEVRAAIALAVGTATLHIYLPQTMLGPMHAKLEAAAASAGHKGSVRVRADPALNGSDVRVEWDNGFMEYSFQTVCDRILDSLRASLEQSDPAKQLTLKGEE